MPKEPSLPAVHLAGVERARYVVAAGEATDRNGRQIAAAKGPDAIPPVRGVDATRGRGGAREAHAHELKKRKKREKPVEKPAPPPDPEGRGKAIDLKA